MISKRFKCIRINDENENKYLLTMKYKDLIEITEVNKFSVNRIVDEEKAGKMIDFIKSKEKFYPTIMMVVNPGCQLDYDELASELCLKSENDKFLGVIDGQHRYTSIELMLKNKELKGKDRDELERKEQSVFLIDNLSKQQQRELFLEINGTPNKVKKGTQLRLMITASNHYGLEFLKNNKEFIKFINFDEDQVLKDERRIPYKFILKANEELLKNFDEQYKSKQDDLNIYYDSIEYIWREILNKINQYSDKFKNSIYSLEIYYIAIFSQIYENVKTNSSLFTNDSIKEEFYKIKKILDVNPVDFKDDIDKLVTRATKIAAMKKKINEVSMESGIYEQQD